MARGPAETDLFPAPGTLNRIPEFQASILILGGEARPGRAIECKVESISVLSAVELPPYFSLYLNNASTSSFLLSCATTIWYESLLPLLFPSRPVSLPLATACSCLRMLSVPLPLAFPSRDPLPKASYCRHYIFFCAVKVGAVFQARRLGCPALPV